MGESTEEWAEHKHEPCIFCARTDIAPDEDCPWGCTVRHPPPGIALFTPEQYLDRTRERRETTEEWAEQQTRTKSCRCIQHAREHLSNAQNLNETEGMGGHAFFVLGAAVNSLINHVDGKHDPD